MKRFILAAALALVAVFSAHAQPSPGNFAQRTPVAGYPVQIVATGAQAAARGLNVAKTYQLTAQTSSGAGTISVNIDGSNDGVTWDNFGNIQLTLSSTTSSGSFYSLDRYMFVRANCLTLTGTGAAYTVWMGY